MALTTSRKVTLMLGVGVVLLAVMGVASLVSVRRLVSSARWVAHTHEVRAALAAVHTSLARSDAAAYRAAVQTPSSSTRAVADANLATSFTQTRELAAHAMRLTADNPEQQRRLGDVHRLLDERERRVRAALTVVAGASSRPGVTLDSVFAADGEKTLTARTDSALDRADDAERRLLAIRASSASERLAEAVTVVVILLFSGAALGLYARRSIQRDIAQRARMEAAIRAAEQRFHAVFDQTFQFTALLTPAGESVELNSTALALAGEGREAALGRPFWELPFWDADDRERVRRAVAESAAGAFVRFECTVRGRDGAMPSFDVSCKPMHGDAHGATTMVIVEGRDISQRKAMEAALRASEAKFSGILSIAADAIVTVDEGQRIQYFNAGAERIFGWAAHEIVGQPLDVLLPTRARPVHERYVREFGSSGETARGMGHRREVSGRRRDGEEFPAEASISRLQTVEGVLYTAVVRDVTDRKRAEDRERFLAVAGAALGASLAIEQTLSVIVNLAVPTLGDLCLLEVWTGDDGDGIPGSDADALSAIAHIDEARGDMLRDLRQRHPPVRQETHPISVVRRTGRPIVLREPTEEAVRSALLDEAHGALVPHVPPRAMMHVPVAARGHVLGVLSCGAAIGRTYGEDDLDLASELARRAALAIDNARLYEHSIRARQGRDEVLGVVSHDLRNPLSTINMCASALLDPEPPTTAGVRSMAEIIQRSTDWMQRIIRDLLDVTSIEAGQLALERHQVSPVSVIETVRELMAVQMEGAGLEFDASAADGLPLIEADHERVVQVLLNLIGNAVKFTPAGGKVSARAEPNLASNDGNGDGDGDGAHHERHVRFCVSDTGPGIPTEHLAHLFDRFWQVRAQGRAGAGLGLAIAKGIVEAHGGAIGVESTVGQGTMFWFTIPVARRGGAKGPPPSTPAAEARGIASGSLDEASTGR